jgi:hypothetical protein
VSVAVEANNFAVISRRLVLKKLAQSFPDPATAAEALECLGTYRDNEVTMNLVHVAIIKLSEGMLWRLRELVREVRRTDVRNTAILQAAIEPEQHKLYVERHKLVKAGGDTRFMKKISPKKIAAMKNRDHAQWVAWLSSE